MDQRNPGMPPRAACGRFFVARHGLTQGNLERRQVGLRDEPLHERGMRQACGLAAAVRRLPVTAVWTSPVCRAFQTAEVVAKACALPLRVEPGLMEIDPGPWQGLTDDEIAERFPAAHAVWNTDPARLLLPGRESLSAARDRIREALDRILAEAGTPLCVTHLGVIRITRILVTRDDLSSFGSAMVEHCIPVECVRDGTGWRMAEWRRTGLEDGRASA